MHHNYPAADRAAPVGGYKRSGNGRENGRWGLEEFLEVRAVLGYEVKYQGVSTRSVDDLLQAMRKSEIPKSQVSRLCGEIDEKVKAFLVCPIGKYPAWARRVRQRGL